MTDLHNSARTIIMDAYGGDRVSRELLRNVVALALDGDEEMIALIDQAPELVVAAHVVDVEDGHNDIGLDFDAGAYMKALGETDFDPERAHVLYSEWQDAAEEEWDATRYEDGSPKAQVVDASEGRPPNRFKGEISAGEVGSLEHAATELQLAMRESKEMREYEATLEPPAPQASSLGEAIADFAREVREQAGKAGNAS
jgi:hypothetical protein